MRKYIKSGTMTLSEKRELCPLAEVDTRLDDVRTVWIETLRKYNKPEEFRRSLNACITTLRTVTFVLQSNKGCLPNFNAWYSTWQERMKSDKVMRWSVESRNYIEKEGDLKTLSVANAKIVTSFGLELHQKFPVDPFLSTEEIADMIRKTSPVSKGKEDSTLLEVERRWVDINLPEYEVLDALSYCYSFLTKLVEDAHVQIGIQGLCVYRKTIGVIDVGKKHIQHLGGRVPCMIATRENRTVMMKLSTGEVLSIRTHVANIDRKSAEEAAKRYGYNESLELFKKKPQNLLEQAQFWFNTAKMILTKDGYLIPTIILGPPNPGVFHFALHEQIDKQIMWKRITQQIEISGAEWFVFIGEAWLRTPEEITQPKDRQYKPREMISIIGASKDEGFVSIGAEFKRENNNIHLLKENIRNQENGIETKQLEPIRKIWKGKSGSKLQRMVMPTINLDKLPWIEDEKVPCPCGSGVSFVDCCKKYIPKDDKLPKKSGEVKIEEREKLYRGALTKYIGYVLSYTIPAIKASSSAMEQLVAIDIGALRELSEKVALCLKEQGKIEEGAKVFKHLRETIPLPGLDKRMIFMEGLWYDAMLGDRTKAQELLSTIDIQKEEDLEILQLYLQIFEISTDDRIQLIERILKKTHLPSEALQYATLKAISLHMKGNNKKALEVINHGIESYVIEPEHIPNDYYVLNCGHAYRFKWSLTRNEDDFYKSLKYFECIDCKKFTPYGKAEIYREIALLYFEHKDYGKSVNYYKLSLKAIRTVESEIHLAECYVQMGHAKKAKLLLDSITYDNIPDVCRLEFLRTQTSLAIASGDKKLGESVSARLRLLTTDSEYFEKQRLENINNLRQKFGK